MSADEEIATYVAQQVKRRRRTLLLAGAVAALVVAGVAAWSVMRVESRCDAGEARAFLNNSRIPASMLGEVCRFDPPIAEALRAMAGAPPMLRNLEMMKGVAESGRLFESVCPGGLKALAQASRVAPADQAQVLAESCDLSLLGLTAAEARGYAAPRLAFALVVYGQLEASDPALAESLARAVVTRP